MDKSHKVGRKEGRQGGREGRREKRRRDRRKERKKAGQAHTYGNPFKISRVVYMLQNLI